MLKFLEFYAKACNTTLESSSLLQKLEAQEHSTRMHANPDRGLYPDSSFHPDSGLSQGGTDSGLHIDSGF